jgi:hypothetical protein
MQEYVTIKTKSGIDIVGVLMQDDGDFVIIENPLEIDIDPQEGMFAKSFLLLSEQNSVLLKREDIFFVQIANAKAIEYYEAFRERLKTMGEETMNDDEYASDLEELFQTLLDSKVSTKH